jgi:hypothetical protein
MAKHVRSWQFFIILNVNQQVGHQNIHIYTDLMTSNIYPRTSNTVDFVAADPLGHLRPNAVRWSTC